MESTFLLSLPDCLKYWYCFKCSLKAWTDRDVTIIRIKVFYTQLGNFFSRKEIEFRVTSLKLTITTQGWHHLLAFNLSRSQSSVITIYLYIVFANQERLNGKRENQSSVDIFTYVVATIIFQWIWAGLINIKRVYHLNFLFNKLDWI